MNVKLIMKIDKNREKFDFRKKRDELKMNFFQKIFWRLKFLFFESWGKSLPVIFFSLGGAENRNASALVSFLVKHNVLKINGKDFFIDYKGYKIYFDKNSDTGSLLADLVSIFGRRDKYFNKNFINNSAYYFEGPYENDNIFMEKGDCVFDVGANIGIFSILASQSVGKNGKVLAFEPISLAREYLDKNIKANRLNNVFIQALALGDQDGFLDFSLVDNLGDCSGYFPDEGKTEKVQEVTLDGFVSKNKIEKVDFIKADIEGMERVMLRGAEKTIKKFKPKLSICVYHREDDPELIYNLIKGFVPEYKTKMTETKLFAWI